MPPPNPLVSLWDMLLPFVSFLGGFIAELHGWEVSFLAQSRHDPNAKISPGFAELMGHKIGMFRVHARLANLTHSVAVAGLIRHDLAPDTNVADARHLMKQLCDAIRVEVSQREFLFVDPAVAPYYNHPLTGWGDSPQRLKCQSDIEEASRCYALQRYTATVFHLMRVAELGLRALARKAKVTIPKKGPLEWHEWSDMIKAIRAKAETVATTQTRGPKKDTALEFYRGTLGEFEAFKDAYRNHVSHVRGSYDKHQASSAMQHVREFMLRLAAGIDKRTL